jgi:hypothetical protein
MLANIIAVFVMIMIAVALYPAMQRVVDSASTNLNMTEESPMTSTTLNILPGAFIAVTVLIGIGVAYLLMHSTEEEPEESEEEDKPKPKPKPHKQTYLEYVKERKEVERLMSS